MTGFFLPWRAHICAAAIMAIGCSLAAMRNDTIVLGAALLDILITAPLAFYLIARRQDASLRGLWPIMGIGISALWFTAPDNIRDLVNLPMVVGALEIMLMAIVGITLWRATKAPKKGTQDAVVQSEALGREIAGNSIFGAVLGAEIATLRYFFRAPNRLPDGVGAVAPGARALMGALLGAFLVEMIAVHIVAHLFSPLAAWILTGLTGYSMIMLIAHIRALPRRPHTRDGNVITLRNGLFSTAEIMVSQITEIRAINASNASGPEGLPEGTRYLSVFGTIEANNVEITLADPAVIKHAYGLKRHAHKIRFYAATPSDLVSSPAGTA